jgi:hypothetical protein
MFWIWLVSNVVSLLVNELFQFYFIIYAIFIAHILNLILGCPENVDVNEHDIPVVPLPVVLIINSG